MLALGIETSCDESAVAIVDGNKNVLSHKLISRFREHQPYGGIVPEIAARAHLEHIDRLILEALDDAEIDLKQIDIFAASAGPGLIGGLIVGVMTAKALASMFRKPFIAVNHLEAHALTVRFTNEIEFPFLLLLVSGGHCQLLIVEGVGRYKCIGNSLDDAAGECFDKVAKMLGLEMPGGPAIQEFAKFGDPKRFSLPKPLKKKDGCDFSFSGLKTAVKNKVDYISYRGASKQDLRDLAASAQEAIINHLIDRTKNGLEFIKSKNLKSLVLSGGVASNELLRSNFNQILLSRGMDFYVPPVELCTDNGIMVAWAGLERYKLGFSDPLSFKPKPRWPLDKIINNK